MSINRFVFSLSDGIDSLTGAHKGRGIINYNHEDTKSKVNSGETQYNVILINNYSDLYNALDLNMGLTAPINPSNSITAEASIFKQAKLSNQTVSLLVKGKYIDCIQLMPPDAKIDSFYVEELKKHPDVFTKSYGDEYISQVMYGRKIYALINFKNTSKEDVLEYKLSLEATLHPKAGAKAGTHSSSIDNVKNTVSNINIEYSGVKLEPPGVTSSIDELFAFIDKFNKAEPIQNGCPIGFVSEPYATIISLPESTSIYEQAIVIKSLISKCDQLYNQIRFFIPTLQMMYSGVTYFRLQQLNPELFSQIKKLLNLAYEYQKALETIMLEVSVNRFDLTGFPERILDKSILKNANKIHEVKSVQSFHQHQYQVYDQLNALVQKYTGLILNIELTANEIARKLIARIVKIPSDEIFSLNLPAGGISVRWDIIQDQHNPVDHFDLQMIKPKKFFCTNTSTIFKNIVNGMEVKLNVQAKDQLQIKTNSQNKINVVASVIGLSAFDPLLPRSETEWIAEKRTDLFMRKVGPSSLSHVSMQKNTPSYIIDKNSAEYKILEKFKNERAAAISKEKTEQQLEVKPSASSTLNFRA